MAKDCRKEREDLAQILRDEATATGESIDEKAINDKIDDYIRQYREATDEFDPTIDPTEGIDLGSKQFDQKLSQKNTIDKLEAALENISTKTEYDDYEIIKSLIADQAKHIDMTGSNLSGLSGVRSADVVFGKIMRNHLHKLDPYITKMQQQGDDLARAFHGDTEGVDPDIIEAANILKAAHDEIKLESQPLDVTIEDVRPNVNLGVLKKRYDNDLADLRATLNRHAKNGKEFLDRYVDDGYQVLGNNQLIPNTPADWPILNRYLGDDNFFGAFVTQLQKDAKRVGWAYDWGDTPVQTMKELARRRGIKTEKISQLELYMNKAGQGVFGSVYLEKGWRKAIVNLLRTGRPLTAIAYLGKAAIYTPVDWVNTAAWNKTIGINNTVDTFNPVSRKRVREVAEFLSVQAEIDLNDRLGSFGMLNSRFEPDLEMEGGFIYQSSMAGAQFAMKAFGITLLTRMNKQKAVANLLGGVGMNIRDNVQWKDLNRRMKSNFAKFGIDEADWQEVLNSRAITEDGYFDPDMLSNVGTKNRMTGWARSNAETSVIEPEIYDDVAISVFGYQPGSLEYEAVKTMFQFMAFPVSHTRKVLSGLHYQMNNLEMTKVQQAAAWASLTGVMIATGMVVANMKAIAVNLVDGVTGEKDWVDEILLLPGTDREGKFLFETLTYGSVGGMYFEYLMNFTGLQAALKEKYGMYSRNEGLDSFMGAFPGTVFDIVQTLTGDLINNDIGEIDKTAFNFLYELSALTPGQSTPIFGEIFNKQVRATLKELGK